MGASSVTLCECDLNANHGSLVDGCWHQRGGIDDLLSSIVSKG